ncbi:hypothetical protein V4B83_23440 [Klebsiella pneumoniae]
MLNFDVISKRLGQCLDILLLKHPMRTVFGIFLGYILYTCLYTLKEYFKAHLFEVDNVHYIGCFILGILIFHTNTIIDVYNGTAMDEEISNLINAITKRTDLSEPQKAMMITEIIQNEINKLGKRGLEEVAKNVIHK